MGYLYKGKIQRILRLVCSCMIDNSRKTWSKGRWDKLWSLLMQKRRAPSSNGRTLIVPCLETKLSQKVFQRFATKVKARVVSNY